MKTVYAPSRRNSLLSSLSLALVAGTLIPALASAAETKTCESRCNGVTPSQKTLYEHCKVLNNSQYTKTIQTILAAIDGSTAALCLSVCATGAGDLSGACEYAGIAAGALEVVGGILMKRSPGQQAIQGVLAMGGVGGAAAISAGQSIASQSATQGASMMAQGSALSSQGGDLYMHGQSLMFQGEERMSYGANLMEEGEGWTTKGQALVDEGASAPGGMNSGMVSSGFDDQELGQALNAKGSDIATRGTSTYNQGAEEVSKGKDMIDQGDKLSAEGADKADQGAKEGADMQRIGACISATMYGIKTGLVTSSLFKLDAQYASECEAVNKLDSGAAGFSWLRPLQEIISDAFAGEPSVRPDAKGRSALDCLASGGSSARCFSSSSLPVGRELAPLERTGLLASAASLGRRIISEIPERLSSVKGPDVLSGTLVKKALASIGFSEPADSPLKELAAYSAGHLKGSGARLERTTEAARAGAEKFGATAGPPLNGARAGLPQGSSGSLEDELHSGSELTIFEIVSGRLSRCRGRVEQVEWASPMNRILNGLSRAAPKAKPR